MSGPRPVTIVLPMLNESASAESVVMELRAAFPEGGRALSVVCVNDGSEDETAEIIGELASRFSWVEARSHDSRRGYGAAIRTGLAAARTPLVGWMDADGQYDPADFERLLADVDRGAVGSIGVRHLRADDAHRRWLGKTGSVLASVICRHRLLDADAGIKVFDAQAVDLSLLRANGSYISTDALVRSFAVGRVEQRNVSHRQREAGEQTGASFRVLAGLVADFARCIFR